MDLKILFYSTLFYSIFLNNGVIKAQHTQSDFEEVINCLNNKIKSYNIGVSNLDLIFKDDTATYEIPLYLNHQIDSTIINYPIVKRSYRAINTYNKLNITFKIVYHYSRNIRTVVELEKLLLDEHFLDIDKYSTESMIRLENLIVSISISTEFKDSLAYLRNILFRLVLDYINICNTCKR